MKVTFAHYQSNSRQCLYWNTSDINSIFLLFLQLYNYLYIAVQTKIVCAGYWLVIPVHFHFHSYEKTVNWLMKETQVTDIKLQGNKYELDLIWNNRLKRCLCHNIFLWTLFLLEIFARLQKKVFKKQRFSCEKLPSILI